MKHIRRGTFETNSSSTHSICICMKEDYNKWIAGEMIYDYYCEKLVPIEEKYKGSSYRYRTYEQYNSSYDLNEYKEEFTTPNGEQIVVFGEYGYDG